MPQFEISPGGLMARSHLDAPDDTPTRDDAIEHFLAEARADVLDYLRNGYVGDLEDLYRELDGDDATTFWRAFRLSYEQARGKTCSVAPAINAFEAMVRVRAEEMAEEAMA